METKLLQLAMNNLLDEVEKLKAEVKQIRTELSESKMSFTPPPSYSRPHSEDELMDIKEVQSMLGICYNSLAKLVRKGLLKPIRINQRRVRFSRMAVTRYITSLQ